MAHSNTAAAAIRRPPEADTKRRMVEALREILKTKPAAEVRASEIASAVGSSQPNFYKHFVNLREALLLCADLSWSSYPQIGHLITDDLNLAVARKIARRLFAFWNEHATTLSWGYLVEIGASQAEYVAMREKGQKNLVDACAAQIGRSRAAGRLDSKLDPLLAAYFVVSRLDNFGMAQELVENFGGYRANATIDVCAKMLLTDLGVPAR
jgi:AcrR family transcriptional regulator